MPGWHEPFFPSSCPSDTCAGLNICSVSYRLAQAKGFSARITCESVYKCKRQSKGYLEMARHVCTSNYANYSCKESHAQPKKRCYCVSRASEQMLVWDGEKVARSCNYFTGTYYWSCREHGTLLPAALGSAGLGFWKPEPVPAVFVPICSFCRCLQSSRLPPGS